MTSNYISVIKKSSLWFSSTIFLLLSSSVAIAQSVDRPHQFNARDLQERTTDTDWEIAQFDPETETEIEIEEAPEVDVDPPEVDVQQVRAGENLAQDYIGIGGNIGITGEDSSIGNDFGFSVLGKTAFTSNIALHSALIFGDDSSTLLSLTYGVPITYQDAQVAYPFVGGGVVIDEIFDEFDLGGLITTGVDVPISSRFTGTARLNIGITDDETGLGLLLGVGYNL